MVAIAEDLKTQQKSISRALEDEMLSLPEDVAEKVRAMIKANFVINGAVALSEADARNIIAAAMADMRKAIREDMSGIVSLSGCTTP